MKDYSFGNYICALRMGLGLSQFQLGALVGVTDKAVSKWENGDAKPKLATCFRLADVLNVPIDELLSCKEHPLTMARKDHEKMNKLLWLEAYDRLKIIYGSNPPAVCWSRLAAEEAALHNTNAVQGFAVVGKMEEMARKHNALFYPMGAISSSFAAWLFGATKVNPLPPHYRCPKCGATEFVPDVADGFDLPAKTCTCGEAFIRDGHNIPFEGYAKSEQRGTHVELRVSRKFRPIAVEVVKEFYAGKAELMPIKLLAENEHPISVDRYVVLKERKPKPALSEDGAWHSDAEEYWRWLEDETTFMLVGSGLADQIQIAQEKTGTQIPDPLMLNTQEMLERLYQKRHARVPFITDCIPADEHHDFDLLLRIDGFVHGTGAWLENGFGDRHFSNGEQLVKEGRAAFREVPAVREDLWHDISSALNQCGIRDNGLALQVMEAVGKFGKKQFKGRAENLECTILSIGLPEWYPEYLKKVMYLFPKGHCVALLLVDMIYEWYAANYPDACEAAD